MLPEIAVDVDATEFDDVITELVCELEDDGAYECGPLDWPDWCDDRWELGPGPADALALEPPAPEPEPFEPSPEDLAEYAAWSLELDRRRDFVEAMERADVQEAIEDARRAEFPGAEHP